MKSLDKRLNAFFYDMLFGDNELVDILPLNETQMPKSVYKPVVRARKRDAVMSDENLEFFKKLLAVPTRFYEEERMTRFLDEYLSSKGYEHFVDDHGNVYATKGNADYVPCVIAHIDTVHHIVEDMRIIQQGNTLYAIDSENDPIGIGGDDKCGVFIALRLLEEFENIKVAFFVSEEIGCIGSKNCNVPFFNNVGYTIQFDAPEDYMITHYCDGTKVFDENGEFFGIVKPIIKNHFGERMELFKHPYTDVSIMARKFKFSNINLSCGYYDLHTRHEYVQIDIVEDSVTLGREMIQALGNRLYYFESTGRQWPR